MRENFDKDNCQKMVNMLFKYLTCFGDYDEFADLFSYCHIPIDRNILESFRNNYGVANITSNMKYRYTNVTTGSVEEEPWSRISKDAYKFYEQNLKVALDFANGTVTISCLDPYVTQVREANGFFKVTFDISTGEAV